MSDKTCSNCRHYRPYTSPLRDDDGACRRYPPTVAWMSAEPGFDGKQGSFWPSVSDDDYCGEFAPKDGGR